MKGILILLLLVLVGASVVSPEVRQHTLPIVRPIVAPLARLVGPHVHRVRDPFYRKAADSELRQVMRRLNELHPSGRGVPTGARFQRFLRENVAVGEDGADPWGSPYYILLTRSDIILGSPGPDRTLGNEDDVRVKGPRGD